MTNTTKFCTGCNTTLPVTEFYTNGKNPSGSQKYKPTCKVCEARDKRKKYDKIIADYYGGIKCSKCGFIGHPQQFDCHHRVPSTKSFGIAVAVNSNFTKSKLIAELEKCDLLCANCHRLEHVI